MNVSIGGRALAGFALLISAGAGSAAYAQKGDFGAASFQSARYCRTEPGGGGDIIADDINCMAGRNPRIQTIVLGGPGLGVTSDVTTDIGGRIFSDAQFGELDLPIVKSGAWADADTRLASTIVTYMRFTYTGAVASPYALDALIDWTSSGAPGALADLANDPAAPVGEYGGEGFGSLQLFLFAAGAVPKFSNAGEIVDFLPMKDCGSAGLLGRAGVTMGTASAGYGEATALLGTACGGGQIILQPGQSYTLFTQTQTIANRNGFMDATNTIRVQLSDELPEEVKATLRENIITARSIVPEPASWAMMIAGFGLVGAVARRRRMVAA
jgi:hypothetical protein